MMPDAPNQVRRARPDAPMTSDLVCRMAADGPLTRYQREVIGELAAEVAEWAAEDGGLEKAAEAAMEERDALRARVAALEAAVRALRQRVYEQMSMCSECDNVEQFVKSLDQILAAP
jgi:uncharacterized protein YceH (UPF0502 family)